MPVAARDLERLLLYKFGFERAGGKKHDKYRLYVEGKTVALTYLSGLAGDIDDTLLGAIAQQMCVTMSQFKGMRLCDIDRDGYLDILRERGRL
jgi:hypothetical protein